MKKFIYLIVIVVILGLILTGCSLLSNISQVPATEQSGITYLTKHTEGHPFTTDLIADGGDPALAIDVGDVLVWNDGGYLYVKYVTEDGWCLTETHLAVVITSYSNFPMTKTGNPKVGKFPYKCCYDEMAGNWVFEYPLVLGPNADCNADGATAVTLTEITYTIPLTWGIGMELFIAAHASLLNMDNIVGYDPDPATGELTIPIYQEETGWGAGEDFLGNNWATYFTYTVQQLPKYGLVLWLDAGKGITQSGGFVSEWKDQSVNGNDAAQTNSLYQPTYVENGQNGNPVVRFTGEGEQYLRHDPILTMPTNTNDYTAFYVLKLTRPFVNKYLYYYHAGAVSSGYLGFFAEYSLAGVGWGSVGRHPTYNDFRVSEEYPTEEIWRIHTHQPDALYKNGDEVDYALLRDDDVYAGGLTDIGSRSDNPSLYFVGDIAEILVYDRILTDSERIMVELYLNAKYDIY